MPWIACTLGDDRGLVEELAKGQPLIVGREEGCDLRLCHASASRRHCQLTLKGAILEVRDLGSSNGIKQKGKQIKSGVLKLKPLQTFDIGGDRFVFMQTYEQYVEIVEKLKGDLNLQSIDEMKANYSKLINDVARTQKLKQPKPSFFRRWFGRDRSV